MSWTSGGAVAPRHRHSPLSNWLSRPQVEWAALAAITLAAAVLRFFRLGDWSFWGDEAFTVRHLADGFAFTPLRASISILLIHAAVQQIGLSEWSARLVPALIGVASVPLLHWPVRRLFGPAVALAASLLLAVSTWHLYWSQNARFYVALLLLYSLALLAFFLALEEDRPGLMVLALVLLGLAAKERLLALFFVPVALGYLVLLRLLRFERPPGLRWRNLAILFVPGALGGLVFVWPFVLHWRAWLTNFGFTNNSPAWIAAGVAYYVGLPVLCLGALAAVYLVAQRRRAGLLLALAAVVPVASVAALAAVHYTANRYAFVALTAWIVLAAVALVELWRHVHGPGRWLAAGVLALAVAAPLGENALYFQYQNGNREDARGALQFVAARRAPGDVIAAPNLDLAALYLGGPVQHITTFDPAQLPPGTQRVWIVEDMNLPLVAPAQSDWVRAHAVEVANFDVHANARHFRMRVHLYRPDGAAQ